MNNQQPPTDKFNRAINYLRISLTDRCNLRCRYCLPEAGVKAVAHADVLRYEELISLAGIFYKLGIKKWRLTGGEPLIKNNLAFLVKGLKNIGTDVKLALTTNGILLTEQIEALVQNGISRLNISLDTLKADRFHYLTRGGELTPVLKSIDAALNYSIDPLRLNTIIFKHYNEDEILDFARLAVEKPVYVRFIEYMPLGDQDFYARFGGVSGELIKSKICETMSLEPVPTAEGTPAVYYRPAKGAGLIGFINPLSHAFCGSCNRLRLNSVGSLQPCLFSDVRFDLKTPLRANNLSLVETLIGQAITSKPAHYTLPAAHGTPSYMSSIGG